MEEPKLSLYAKVMRTTYKPGYRFELTPYEGFAYKLSLHTDIAPKEDEIPGSPLRLIVSKLLPREVLDNMSEAGITDVLLGLAFWWETHELAEWFKVGGETVLPVEYDHAGYIHNAGQMYADLDMLRLMGAFLRERRFR